MTTSTSHSHLVLALRLPDCHPQEPRDMRTNLVQHEHYCCDLAKFIVLHGLRQLTFPWELQCWDLVNGRNQGWHIPKNIDVMEIFCWDFAQTCKVCSFVSKHSCNEGVRVFQCLRKISLNLAKC